MVAPLRWEGARAAWLAGKDDAVQLLGTLRDIDGIHGSWLALRGRWVDASPEPAGKDAGAAGAAPTAEQLWEHALAVDPLSVDVACEGYPRHMPLPSREPPLPNDPTRRALCEHVRSLPLRGSE